MPGFAGFERDSIIARSIAGTNRLAREGVWLGGIAPYGYRVNGRKQDARIVLSTESISETVIWSEVEAVCFIYYSLACEGRSCEWVARELNARGIPPVYTRDGRQRLSNKRYTNTDGIWRAGRIRNLVVNTLYKGVHTYGRRTKRERELIERTCPAIVDAETWQRAQDALKRNQLFSWRNAKRRYLLRGFIKCGLCGLNYCGTGYPVKDGEKFYYVCSGKHGSSNEVGRGKYGRAGRRCPSKSIPGEIEDIVWQDVEGYLRNPGAVLDQVAAKLTVTSRQQETATQDAEQLQRLIDAKDEERNTVLTLYRRKRIDARALDAQLDAIDEEEKALREKIKSLQSQTASGERLQRELQGATELLTKLAERLDNGTMDWDAKRSVVEMLIEKVVVTTIGEEDLPQHKKEAEVTIFYKFTPVVIQSDTDSWQPPE